MENKCNILMMMENIKSDAKGINIGTSKSIFH